MLALFQGLATELGRVEVSMAKALASDQPRVQTLIEGLGTFHGKMLRPTLLLQVAQTVGTITQDHISLGAALEMIHTATLIHDDMIDAADTRRGRHTAHVAHGTNVAVLLGDYFYTHAFSLVSSMGEPWIMERLTGITNVICEGELHQMLVRRDPDLAESEYERIIYAKTAALCELAAELGALSAPPEQRAAAAAFGRACGMAFQIVDDCLDFTGDPRKIGKTLATDLERGLITLPVLRTLQHAESAHRADLGRQIAEVTARSDLSGLRREVLDGGGVEAALKTAKAHVVQALVHLTRLPPGSHRNRLGELAEFIVHRDF